MFRFTIRDLLWMMVVVGVVLSLGTAWWFERSRSDKLARWHELNANLNLLEPDQPLMLSRGTAVTVYTHKGQVALKFSPAAADAAERADAP